MSEGAGHPHGGEPLPGRLVNQPGRAGGVLRRYLRHPHGGDVETAWRRLQAAQAHPSARRRGLQIALFGVASAIVGAMAMFVLLRPGEIPPAVSPVIRAPLTAVQVAPRPTLTPRSVSTAAPRPLALERQWFAVAAGTWEVPDEMVLVVDAGARVRAAQRRRAVPSVRIESGGVSLSVVHKPRPVPFEVVAPPYVFTVLGTVFRVERDSATVELVVEQGRVAVSRGGRRIEVVTSGGRWQGPTRASARRIAAAIPPQTVASAPVAAAPTASAPVATAPTASAPVAASPRSPLEAEVALYELARARRAGGDGAGALVTLQELRRRFPAGALRAETDLSVIELLAGLGHHDEALAESGTLLSKATGGERAAELRLLRGNIFREVRGDLGRALDEYRLAVTTAGRPGTADEAAFLLAATQEGLGRRAEAIDSYRRYLQRPRPRRATEARARLRALEPAPSQNLEDRKP